MLRAFARVWDALGGPYIGELSDGLGSLALPVGSPRITKKFCILKLPSPD